MRAEDVWEIVSKKSDSVIVICDRFLELYRWTCTPRGIITSVLGEKIARGVYVYVSITAHILRSGSSLAARPGLIVRMKNAMVRDISCHFIFS